MIFFDSKTASVIESDIMEHKQLEIKAEELLTTPIEEKMEFIDKLVIKPKVENKPVCYNLVLFEDENNILDDGQLRGLTSLILSSLTTNILKRNFLDVYQEIPVELSNIYASPFSIINFINYGISNPVQIKCTRQYMEGETVLDREVFFLV